jgi:sigma-B regulation protein RsbU (phosphoserine phosphatase)
MGSPDYLVNLFSPYGSMLIDLIEYVCTLLIFFYILFQAGVIHHIIRTEKKSIAVWDGIIIVVLFSALGIIASIKAYHLEGGVLVNSRDLPCAIAGMLGGPITGLATGVIAGVYRYFMGGETALVGLIMSLLSGLGGGVVFLIIGKRFIRPLYAAIYAFVQESIHMLLVYLLSTGPNPLHSVKILAMPMVLSNTFGLFMFSFMVNRALNYSTIKTKKDKIEAELKTAHEIQAGMLPRIFPAFPDRPEFDIYACMNPAKDVGGDFYDFFLVGHEKLCFIVGDVSDKGVPAALFMTIVKTLLKTEALRNSPPNDVLLRVNEILYPDNESCSFVTVFCGIMDLATGAVEYSNGGHLPPFILSPDGRLTKVPIDRNFVVGAMPNLSFTKQECRLEAGDMIFLYTDGATEASNPSGAMFTEARLAPALVEAASDKGNCQKVIGGVLEKIQSFSGEAVQYDDITLLAMRYRGKT